VCVRAKLVYHPKGRLRGEYFDLRRESNRVTQKVVQWGAQNLYTVCTFHGLGPRPVPNKSLVALLRRGIGLSQGMCLQRNAQHWKKRGLARMPRAGFEPMIPILEWSKTIRALDSAATGTGLRTKNIIRVIRTRMDEKGGACSTHDRNEKCTQNISHKTWWEEITWKN
jgi:hypothetical protein